MSPTPEVPANSPFTLHNIPFGVISTSSNTTPRCASAIGDHAIDLGILFQKAEPDIMLGKPAPYQDFEQQTLNAFAGLPSGLRSNVRRFILDSLLNNTVPFEAFLPLDTVRMHMPMQISGYSDFFCSLEHCQNCSPMTGGNIPKNFYYSPSVYNGRASSVVVSPDPIRRPKGVMYDTGGKEGNPVYGASLKMDFELEMGFFVSKPVPWGQSLDIEKARDHIFGFVVLNDWSSRDLQAYEMTPLGPFHSKGFATSISPWIVTLEALEPFACEPKHNHDSTTFEHLRWHDRAKGTFDIRLTAKLIRNGITYDLVESNLRYMYWTPYQQIVHHAAGGCGLKTGDLLGTGTISGEKQGELGCLYEATRDGNSKLQFDDGSELGYLEDGDEIILEAWCGDGEGGRATIGFGHSRGKLLPSI
ncbi:hypothetical protein M441DRAFT_179957 [Trichoderma asperellum CBS 433.97]|uniref:Fumarylacetoacetase n=1 Tax=Trichoderma asperellum (strain ATCC 204424 / CBS 433.97 / NBRC 101777) TaxID=1042311 RepID=A0A2T3YRF9_TRIA4|nr:hypothetical protein M441DRAFT_179957 [Trichoderma asperellum CBS 433.97]PTB35160.1 hypothetical protein M441DRAFT_179957 [Trichoderma asperellum CBS 433.97]